MRVNHARYKHHLLIVDALDTADGAPLGMVLAVELPDGGVELKAVAVDEAHHDRGIGTRLLRAVLARLRADGVARVVVGTGNAGVGQLAFYQKAGFRLWKIERDFFGAMALWSTLNTVDLPALNHELRSAGLPEIRLESKPEPEPESDNDVDIEVLDRLGRPVRANVLFHSGEHPTLRLRTREGFEVTGTCNHPVLCLEQIAGLPLPADIKVLLAPHRVPSL